MKKAMVIRAKELLRNNSKEFVIEKLISEKDSRTTISSITRVVNEALKT